MYTRMLVPLDGSELAEMVFPYASELAGRLDLDLVLLHVHPPDERHLAPMFQDYVDHASEKIRGQCEEVRGSTLGTAAGTPLRVHGELAEGHPAEEILRYAEEEDIDLILIATHGSSGGRRWALGSVADKLLRASRVPVWVVRAGTPDEALHDRWPQGTMVVPLDGSKLSECVLPHVEALAKQTGTEQVQVVLVTVCEPPFITADYPEASMALSWDEHVKRITEHFREICGDYLAGVEKSLAEKGLRVRSETVIGEEPATEIIEYARRHRSNLILMATHGRSGIGRWAYGSVADRLIHEARSPIFLVRPC